MKPIIEPQNGKYQASVKSTEGPPAVLEGFCQSYACKSSRAHDVSCLIKEAEGAAQGAIALATLYISRVLLEPQGLATGCTKSIAVSLEGMAALKGFSLRDEPSAHVS
jgi:hypothetical protein